MSFEQQFIEAVRRNEVLYDLQHHNYRRVDIKEKIWKQIALYLNSTQKQCKKFWKSLRDHPSGSGMEEPDKKWKFLECLSFLQGVNNPNDIVKLEADDLFSENDDDVTQTLNFSENSSKASTRDSSVPKKKHGKCVLTKWTFFVSRYGDFNIYRAKSSTAKPY